MLSTAPRRLLRRLTRTSPVVVGSIVLHAGLALSLVANGGGHAGASVSLPVASLEVEVEVAPIEAPLLEAVPPAPPVEEPDHDHDPHVATHTHAYPVAPSHDAHPHDPALHHDAAPLAPAPAADEHAHEAASAPAAAVAAVAEAAPAALPTFSIPSGASLVATSGRVSATGTGSGGGGDATVVAGASGSDDVVVPASGVHVAAKLVSSVVAVYPAAARSDDVEGDVGVEFVVDREGRVIEARVARAAGHGFDDAALTAIRRYRFSPAQRDGHAVRVRMPWSVQFRLR